MKDTAMTYAVDHLADLLGMTTVRRHPTCELLKAAADEIIRLRQSQKGSGMQYEPAFPNSISSDGPFGGLSVRDYFAAKAMQAMISTAASPCLTGLGGAESAVASAAYKVADAMLKAREKDDG